MLLKTFLAAALACAFVQASPFNKEAIENVRNSLGSVANDFGKALQDTKKEGIEQLQKAGASLRDAAVYGLDAGKNAADTVWFTVTAPGKVVFQGIGNFVDSYKKDRAEEAIHKEYEERIPKNETL